MLPNPYLIAGALAAILAAYGVGRYDGSRMEKASHLSAEQRAQEAYDAALRATADQIAKINIRNTTIRQQAETVIREVPAYSCVHDPRGMQSINQALVPAGDSSLPATDAAR